MSLNSAQIQKAFKTLGKLIKLSKQGPTDAVTYRTALSGLSEQIATGNSSDATAIVQIGVPASNQLAAITTTLDNVASQAKTLVQTYLQQVMSVDAGLKSGVSVATVGAKLIADMRSAGENVASSGGNPNGILAYFANNFSLQLPPASGDPTIPDSWITLNPLPLPIYMNSAVCSNGDANSAMVTFSDEITLATDSPSGLTTTSGDLAAWGQIDQKSILVVLQDGLTFGDDALITVARNSGITSPGGIPIEPGTCNVIRLDHALE